MNIRTLGKILLGGLAAGTVFGPTTEARACGGFFCSQNQPVNQAAERIVFADNGDGTVTAVIQILYQGSAPNFSWILPISTVPTAGTIAVASNLGFQRLQARTNPQYNLTVRVEGSCKPPPPGQGFGGSSSVGSSGGGGRADSGGGDSGVVVEASGTVGAFEWTAISLDPSLPDPADVAVKWLEDNEYSVVPGTPGLIRPYLADGLYLLALRLTKGADTGSIRPIVLTYEASRPMIPIKLTAVAANENMGVMTWLLSSAAAVSARAVPQNYLSLELNEARINWFNASTNYDSVVTSAADEAGGQGFATEFAAANTELANVIWSPADESDWEAFRSSSSSTFQQAFWDSYYAWGGWDGFWDVVRSVLELPANLTLAELQSCPDCYVDGLTWKSGSSVSDYVDGLEKQVILPVKDLQALFDVHGYTTRLYTTMSAQDMTVDPLFTFNSDLPSISNIHSAERVIECSPDVYQANAPWRIELAQGVVRGTGAQAQSRSWPAAFDSQPANSRILRMAASGPGRVVEDNGDLIRGQLEAYAQTLGTGGTPGSGGQAPRGGQGGQEEEGGSGANAPEGGRVGAGGSRASGGSGDADTPHAGGGCSLAFGGHNGAWAMAAAVAGLTLARRRRRGDRR